MSLAKATLDAIIADVKALQGFEPVELRWDALPDLVLVVRPRS